MQNFKLIIEYCPRTRFGGTILDLHNLQPNAIIWLWHQPVRFLMFFLLAYLDIWSQFTVTVVYSFFKKIPSNDRSEWHCDSLSGRTPGLSERNNTFPVWNRALRGYISKFRKPLRRTRIVYCFNAKLPVVNLLWSTSIKTFKYFIIYVWIKKNYKCKRMQKRTLPNKMLNCSSSKGNVKKTYVGTYK